MARKKPRPTPQPADPLPGLVDAHTHLWGISRKGGGTYSEILRRAVEAGVEKMCTVGDDLQESQDAVLAAQQDSRVYAAVAIHPVNAGQLDAHTRQELTSLAQNSRVVAIGETGLDLYWVHHEPETTAPLETQEESLRWHIDLAVATGKALMIHNRDADADLLRILADSPTPEHTILHCFSSPLEVAEEALARGYILSFAGNVTFKRNDALRQAARLAPPGQLLIETDAPYMTPEPYRGTRNEPALIGYTALCVAQARDQDPWDFVNEVNSTFDEVYGLNRVS